VIAEGIKKPVATNLVVVCCCYDMALYMATKRNALHAPFSFNEVKIKWEQLFGPTAMFGRFLTDEKGERKEGEMFKENNAQEIMQAFREMRAKLPGRKRELIILRPHQMMLLSEDRVKDFLAVKVWEKEL
jgi:hypothetical protein